MAEKELKDLLMEQFNKEYPESPLEVMGDSEYAEIPGWITTGNYALNWIISKDMFKGLPMGRVIIFSGDPASGKSMAAISMMREPSIDTVIYFDTEGGGVTKDFATFLGIDPHKVLYNSMDTVEEMIDKMRKTIDIIEKNHVKKSILLIVDSISMLSTAREMDKEGGCYTPETLVCTIDGRKTICEIKEGDEVLTHLGSYKPVEKVWRFTSEEKPELIEISTETGDTVRLTPDHRLLVQRGGEYVWVEAGNVCVTDELVKIGT